MGYLIVNGQVVGTTFGTPTSFSHSLFKKNADGTVDYGRYQTEHFYKKKIIPVEVETATGKKKWVDPQYAKMYDKTAEATQNAINSGFGIPEAARNSAFNKSGQSGVEEAKKKKAVQQTYEYLVNSGMDKDRARAVAEGAPSASANLSKLETAGAYAGGVARGAAGAVTGAAKKAWDVTGGAAHRAGTAAVNEANSKRNSEIADYDARFSALKSQGMPDEEIERRIGKRPQNIGKLGTAGAYVGGVAKSAGGAVISAGKKAFEKITGAIVKAKDSVKELIGKYITGENAGENRKALMTEIGNKFDSLVDALKPSSIANNVGGAIGGVIKGIAKSNVGQAAINAGKTIISAPGKAYDAVKKNVSLALTSIKSFFKEMFRKKEKFETVQA